MLDIRRWLKSKAGDWWELIEDGLDQGIVSKLVRQRTEERVR